MKISRTSWLGIASALVCVSLGAGFAISRSGTRQSSADETMRKSGDFRYADSQVAPKHGDATVHYDLFAKLLADDRRAAKDTWISELTDPKVRVATQSHPLLGTPAPNFTLHDYRGQPWSLHERLEAGPIVLVFYLGYSCPACVHHLLELNADLDRIERLGAQIVAISGDSPDVTRQRFDRYGALGYPVLADPAHGVARIYGSAPTPDDLQHGTFIIGQDGRVRWANYGDSPFRNNKALLYELGRLAYNLPEPADKEPITP